MKQFGPIAVCGDCPFMRSCPGPLSAEPWFSYRYYCAHYKQGQMVYVDQESMSCSCPLPDEKPLVECD